MNSIAYLPEAVAEIVAAEHWYADQSLEAAVGFVADVRRGLEQIAAHPESWPRHDERHRAYSLDNFPYVLVYRVNADQILIVAVAHNSRRPNYWRKR
ncbi:MAG: type II toxin-antitoxin system RelE/ParE family toxin [Pirellulales bacterium]